MPLPTEIVAVLSVFETAFCQPTWNKLQVIIIGTILARGRRTVTAALRQMGLGDESDYSKYHQVFNRAVWSGLELSKRLLRLISETFGGCLTIVIDEHLERRWGRKIRKLGSWRDPLISSPNKSVSRQGLKWITMAVVLKLPWTSRKWALPFFTVLTTTEKVSEKLGCHHKTLAKWAMEMIRLVRHWMPGIAMKLVGDGSYSVIALGHRCNKEAVSLIAPLRLDARLYNPPQARKPGKRGRTAIVGEQLPKLREVLINPSTLWQQMRVSWYDGEIKQLDYCSGTALWYYDGQKPLPIAWVLVRDPDEELKPRAFFSTNLSQLPTDIVSDFIDRWPIEVTFEESRSHLGIQTQRQWSDLAIERTTPCLFGLFSLICLFANSLYQTTNIEIQKTAWYQKPEPTFADVLATVRAKLWGDFNFPRSEFHPDRVLIPVTLLHQLAQAVCYTH
jgi:DDE superfamily endonuclease